MAGRDSSIWRYFQLLALAALLVAGGFLVWHYDLHTYLQEEKREQLLDFVRSFGIWAPIIFALIYYFATLFFFSAAILTIASGILFGKVWGSVLVVIAATAAAQTGFVLAHYYGSGVLSHVGKQGGTIRSLVETINRRIEKNGFRSFFVLRCLFLPYMPLSYAAGLVEKAKARDFFFATLVTNAIFSPVFVLFGDALLHGPQALILPAVLIGLVLLVPKLVRILQAHFSSSPLP